MCDEYYTDKNSKKRPHEKGQLSVVINVMMCYCFLVSILSLSSTQV